MSGFNKLAQQKRQRLSLQEGKTHTTADPQTTLVGANLHPIAKREEKHVVAGSCLERIPVDCIDLSPYQPRIMTDSVLDSLHSLAKDIERNGQLNPIIVRKKGKRYELIGGERRFRSIKDILQLTHITALVRSNVSDDKAAIQALADNVNRENLSDYESISQIKHICDEFGYDFENSDFVSEKFAIDKSRYFRLKYILELPPFMLDSLSVEPRLISGYIAQEVKIEINKQLNFRSEKEILHVLKEAWNQYVAEFNVNGKRNKRFLSALKQEEQSFENSDQIEKHYISEPNSSADTKQLSDSDIKAKPIKIDFKTDTGVKFGLSLIHI